MKDMDTIGEWRAHGWNGLEVMASRGTKTQNFPDSGFSSAKTFRTKRADPIFATCEKERVNGSRDI